LQKSSFPAHGFFMGLPDKPVTLSTEQIAELNKMLSTLRHDINGDLALIVAAAELIKLNPEIIPRMLTTVLEQPPKIRDRADKFSAAFEKILGITRP
jgi:K+-sensing histidine kinase KdpD